MTSCCIPIRAYSNNSTKIFKNHCCSINGPHNCIGCNKERLKFQQSCLTSVQTNFYFNIYTSQWERAPTNRNHSPTPSGYPNGYFYGHPINNGKLDKVIDFINYYGKECTDSKTIQVNGKSKTIKPKCDGLKVEIPDFIFKEIKDFESRFKFLKIINMFNQFQKKEKRKLTPKIQPKTMFLVREQHE